MGWGAEPRWRKAAAQLGPCSFCWPDLHLSPHHIHYTSQGPSASGTAGSAWWYSAGKECTGQWVISSHNSQRSTQLPTNALILAASLSIALAHAQKGKISSQGKNIYASSSHSPLFHFILNQFGSPAGIRALECWQPQGAFAIWESSSLFSSWLARPLSHTMGHKMEQSSFRTAVSI